ncbi:MAG: hypothetical protein OXM57_14415 [bacterium]|nr:hypothetical protein [bacterium]
MEDDGPKAFEGFASRLGKRYERYIGEQLRLLTHATLHPEVSYGRSQKSVDYIIETPEVVVLVEAKSVAPNAFTRSGIFPDNGDMDRGINRACQQITHTAELMRGGHPEFPDLKARPLRGLVVTRERYLNLPWHHLTDAVKPASIPTTIVSADQLEYALVPGLIDEEACGAQLLEGLATDSGPIETSLERLRIGMNPLLEEIATASSLRQPDHDNASAS